VHQNCCRDIFGCYFIFFTIVIYDNLSEKMNDNRLKASSINRDFVDNYISSIIFQLFAVLYYVLGIHLKLL